MYTDECNSRSNGEEQSPNCSSDIGAGFTEPQGISERIRKARSVNIRYLLKKYKIFVELNEDKIICPFIQHKNGKEKSPSFKIYDQTNSFHCFGCQRSGSVIDFLHYYEGISKLDAINKLLTIETVNTVDIISNTEDYDNKIKLLMDFSEQILGFKKLYSDEKSLLYIENLCKVYDNINSKLNSQALNELNILMLKKINKYINEM